MTALAVMVCFPQTPKGQHFMTRKHYQLVAEQLNFSFTHAPNPNVIVALAANLADQFEQDNPRFNRSIFLAVALA